MPVSLRASGTAVFGVNSITPTIDAAQLAGDMMILIAGGKPYDLGWSVSGWTSLGSSASGTTAAGVDTGSMKMEVWYKIATSDTETDPTVTEGTPTWNVAGAVVMVWRNQAGDVWETPVVVWGADESSGTGISVTFGSDPGVVTDDLVMTACAINTDAMGPLTGDLVPAQAGVTFGTTTQRVEQETTSGGDMALHVSSAFATSGTSSAAPTATGTGTASGAADRLQAAFIRLRTRKSTTPGYVGAGYW
jgi:hypothetical protein